MKYGYLPNNLTQVAECELYMLPGLTADVDAFRIAGITVSRIDFKEFVFLEKSPFRDDLESVFACGNVPYYCVFSSFETGDEQLVGFRSSTRAVTVHRLARALWLFKEGPLYDPMQFVYYKRAGSLVQRDPKTFGRLAYNLSGYELTRPELPLVEGIYYALACFDDARYVPAVDTAERLFVESYSPALLDATDIFLLLLGSFEALAGSASAHLHRAPWLAAHQRELLGAFRQTRNGVAHGKQSAGREQVMAFRAVIRCLLREAIFWAVEDPERRYVTGKGLVNRLLAATDAGPHRLADAQAAYPSVAGRHVPPVPIDRL